MNEPNQPEISTEELLRWASEGADVVSENDLRTLRRYQLVPRPRQVGLGHGRGSTVLYPAEAVSQVRAAMALRKKHRRPGDVMWCLWWEGFPVPDELVQQYVHEAASGVDSAIVDMKRLLEDPDQFDSLLNESATKRISDPALAAVRKRTGKTSFPTVIRVIAEVVTGEFSGLDPDYGTRRGSDEEVVDKAFGVVEARKNSILGVGPWVTRTNDEILREVTAIISSSSFAAQAERTDLDVLAGARDEFKELAGILGASARLFTWIWGKKGLGFGVVSDFLSRIPPEGQVGLLLMWERLMQDSDIRQNYKAMLDVKSILDEAVGRLEGFLRQVRPPALIALMSPRSLRKAFRTPKALQRFQRDLDVLTTRTGAT